MDGSEGMPSYIITNLRYFINYYFAVFLEEKKNELVEDLYNKILELPDLIGEKIDSGSRFNINQVTSKYLHPVFKMVLSTTNAFSASFRLYNPSTNSLDTVIALNSEDVRHSSLNNEKISLDNVTYSVVANTFILSLNERYIPDISAESKNYLKHRSNTKTELCYSVFFKKTAIGTLNFESSISNAFVYDKSYLKKIKTMLEGYLSILFESNDKQWLARRSQKYENQHELKNLILDENIPEEYQKKLSELIIEQDIDMSTKVINLMFLKEYRKEYIKKYKDDLLYIPIKSIRDEMVRDFSHGIKIQIYRDDLFISEYKLNMIKIIYKNILDNYRKHSDIEHDSVFINYAEHSNTLNIISRSSKKLGNEIIKKLLIESISKVDDRKHDGLFIVGMLTRHLNGYAYAYNAKFDNCSYIHVRIPMGKKNG